MSARPVYLCSGGPHSDKKRMTQDLRTALAASGAAGARVAYVGAAHLDRPMLFNMMRPMLLAAGASEVAQVPIVRKPDPERAQSILRGADAVFLSGGEVEDGIAAVRRAGLDGLLRELYDAGIQFFGISAGCIMMGRHWVHWDKEGDDSTSSLFDCLGFLPFTFDAHGEDEDWTELRCALRLLGPGAEGFGLADGGFFRADQGGVFEPLHGRPAVFINKNGNIVGRDGNGNG